MTLPGQRPGLRDRLHRERVQLCALQVPQQTQRLAVVLRTSSGMLPIPVLATASQANSRLHFGANSAQPAAATSSSTRAWP